MRRSWLAAAPSPFAPAGDRLVFSIQGAHESGFGFELWATDGTPGGTQQLHTFQRLPNDPFSYAENLVSDGGRVFFAADDGKVGVEPWAVPLNP